MDSAGFSVLLQIFGIPFPLGFGSGFKSFIELYFLVASEGGRSAHIPLDHEPPFATCGLRNFHVEVLRNVHIANQHFMSRIAFLPNSGKAASTVTDEELQAVFLEVWFIEASQRKTLHSHELRRWRRRRRLLAEYGTSKEQKETTAASVQARIPPSNTGYSRSSTCDPETLLRRFRPSSQTNRAGCRQQRTGDNYIHGTNSRFSLSDRLAVVQSGPSDYGE